jgi:hypothetical protein
MHSAKQADAAFGLAKNAEDASQRVVRADELSTDIVLFHRVSSDQRFRSCNSKLANSIVVMTERLVV